MRRITGIAAASLGAVALAFALAAGAAEKEPASSGEKRAGDTLKERLSDKASDEQRVDDCRVPLDRRGARKRPDCAKPTVTGEARK
jgi:hypothetical protein